MDTLPAGHRTLKSVLQSLRERAGLELATKRFLALAQAHQAEGLQNEGEGELNFLRALYEEALPQENTLPVALQAIQATLGKSEDAVCEWLRVVLETGSVTALVETVEGQPARQIPDYEWADVFTGSNNISWGSIQAGNDRKTILFTDEAADAIIAIYDRENERPFWSQMMTLAWIFHRDQNLVNRVQRAEEGGAEALSFLRLATVTTTDEEDFEAAFDKTGAELNCDAAIRQGPTLMGLLYHLMAGDITATGRRNDEGERLAIPPETGSDYTFYVSDPPNLAPKDRRRSELPVWNDLQFRAEEVRRHYLAKGPVPSVAIERRTGPASTVEKSRGSEGDQTSGAPRTKRDAAKTAILEHYPDGRGSTPWKGCLATLSESADLIVTLDTAKRAFDELNLPY